jgi:pyruvate,water dikinase
MDLLVASLTEEAATGTRDFGAKAARLASLKRAGFPVPDGFAVARSAFRTTLASVLAAGEWPSDLLAAGPAQEDALAGIRSRISAAPLGETLGRSIGAAYRGLGGGAVAVRSSGEMEDEAAFAGAGMQETFLNVQGIEAVERALRECWASIWTARSLGYLARAGTARDVAMGVVVQDLVPAEVAGVAFTQNPLSGDPSELVINCAFGLGPAVAQGLVSPDAYVVERRTGRVRDRVAGDKHLEIAAVGEGVTVRPRAADDARRLALTDAQAATVAELALAVERHLGRPADIEWALAGGRLSLLQARPVTVVPSRPRSVGGAKSRRARTPPERTVWSNVNVGEALPGVATPLTWSVLSEFSARGFRHAFGALGCKVPPDAELVGEVRGRIYLNLSEFMAIASQVPGLSPRTLLSLGGGGGLDALEDAAPEGRAGWLVRLPATLGRFVRHHAGLGGRIAEFERDFDRERARVAARDLPSLSPADLARALADAEDALHRTGDLMLTAASSFLASYVLLRSLLRGTLGDDAPRLETELMSGFSDLESAAPGIALCHIAASAPDDPATRRFFAAGSHSLDELPASAPLRRALEAFLLAHGYRAPREAEIATPRWREDPTLVLAALRALWVEGGRRGLERIEHQRALRAQAAAEVERRVRGPRRSAIRHALASAQRNARLRERLRARVTETLGWFRSIVLEVGARLGDRECGFFLEIGEIRRWLADPSFDPGPIVRARRTLYERNRRLPDPPSTFVGTPTPTPEPVPDGEFLRGLGASAGRARGRARILKTPEEAAAFVPGEVLVVGSADVGWAPLFLSASAVVAELGGPLSHAAIVAREYGVPAVVNVAGATRLLATGDPVEVDGNAGTVLRLPR